MRALLLFLLVGCTSTRFLASPRNPQLIAGENGTGVVVNTTTRWQERIDPNTSLWLQRGDGAWSRELHGRELHGDARGLWIDSHVQVGRHADRVDLVGADVDLLDALEARRPPDAELYQEGETWSLRGSADAMRLWIAAIEADVDAGSFAHDITLQSIQIHTPHGWRPPLYHSRLIDGLRMEFHAKVGWEWNEIAAVVVQNLSGGKTLGAIVGSVALSVVAIPFAFVARGGSYARQVQGPRPAPLTASANVLNAIGAAAESAKPIATWTPRLGSSESLHAKPLFSTGAKVRAIVRPTLSLDGSLASKGDRYSTGVIARARFVDAFELGAGVRQVFSRTNDVWTRSTTPVIQLGAHLPLDAGFRFAIPLAAEVSFGGAVRYELQLPWGLRYTSASGRYFVTAQPVTPSWLRTTTTPNGRFAWSASTELGFSF
jgi:hypothetical protein